MQRSTAYRLLWLATTIILVCSAVLTSTGARGAEPGIIPRVVDLTPEGGEELAPTGQVTFFFNTPMDRPTVEAALSVQAADGSKTVSGKFNWLDDRTAVFSPGQPLNRATEYLFSFKSGARSAAGLPLSTGSSFRIRTTGTLAVAQIIPATGTQDVDADALVTVIFNRPVVPVVPLEEQGKLPQPLSFQPATSGQGTWINSSTYQFKPAQALRGNTTYVVTVDKNLTDQSGAQLGTAVSTTFQTVAPRVIEINPPDNASSIDRLPNIVVAFSQAMDRPSAEAAFSLTGPGGKKPSGTFGWRSDSRSLTFTPDAPLDYGGRFDIKIDQTVARAASGGLLIDGAKSSFTINGLPVISNITPKNNEVTESTVVNLSFNQPMKLENFEKNVTIEPAPPKIDYSFDQYSKQSFQVILAVENKTTYTVTIDPKGLTDAYGTPLTPPPNAELYNILPDGRLQFKFSIDLKYSPQASLRTAGPVGLYSAYAPTTRVYSTHRNIDRLDLELYQLSTNDALPFLSNYVYNDLRTYQPNMTQFLRAWQVKVENPEQVLRYDLLNISANGPSVPPTGASFTCPGSLPPRLSVGLKTGFVLKNPPSPSNLRAEASRSANVIARIPPGGSFTIRQGPQCADGIVWFQVVYKNLTGWVAESLGNTYFLGRTADDSSAAPTSAPVPTAMPGTGNEPLKPGVYLLSVRSPQLVKDADPLKHVMIVATANISLKMAATGAQAWVTDLKTGLPVKGANVQFYLRMASYNADGLQLSPFSDVGKGVTDDNGLVSVTYPFIDTLYNAQLVAVVNDGATFALGSNNLSVGIEPYNYNLQTSFSDSDATIYLYSDRSLYKPGQPVYFKGVLRSKDDVTYGLYAANGGQPIPIEVLNDAGESVYKADAQLTPFGTFSGRFMLDANAALGNYQIVAKLRQPGKTEKDGSPVYRNFYRQVSVAEYRTPEFRIDLQGPDQVVQGDKIRVTVNSSYFFGGALANAPVEWTAQANDYYFDYKGRGAYDFTDFSEDAGPGGDTNGFGNAVSTGKGKTDARGEFVIELPADIGKSKTSKTYTIEATVTDVSKQVVSGRVLVTVHAGELYIGAASEEYVVTAGKQAAIDLIAVDWQSQPLAGVDINARAVEREWRSVKQVSPDTGETVWTYDVKETPIDSATVKSDADGKAKFVFTPPRGGIYKIYATTRDAKGNQVTSSTYVYVAGPDYIPWRQRNTYGFDLKTDKTNYRVGDTASILIASPFQGSAKAWITVERGGILTSQVIDLPTNSTIYKLPIEAKFAPNIFVSVLIVKGTDDKNPIPAFRLGYAALNVDSERYKLNIEVKADKDKAGPREQVTYTLKVTDYAGKPVKAEVGIGLTDLAVLSLLPDTSTPILQHFYEPQGLSVQTTSTLTISVDEQTQTILNTIKGGGGGGPEGGVLEIRQLFVDTPLWSPTVTTDDNGLATVTVTLPDQLTTWRLDARAVTLPTGDLNTTLVGQVTADILSTKPLIVRPLTPRFFIAGDKAELAATVNNNTGADQDVTITLKATGATVTGPTSQTVKIADRGSARVVFPSTVDANARGVETVFSAQTADGKFTDAAKPQIGQSGMLPVYRYEAPETVSTSGVIGSEGGDRLEGILLPARLNVSQGSLAIRVDPSLAVSAVDALKALRNQPNDCTESTASRMLTNAATAQVFNKLKVLDTAVKDSLDSEVNIALQGLYSQQHIDGGFGWCVRDDSSTHVTAYALLALVEAKTAGYTVEAGVLGRAIAYLNGQLGTLNPQSDSYILNRRALVLYALAKVGAGNVSSTLGLFAIRERMSIYARAFLLATINILTPTDSAKINALVSDLQNTAITSASGQHWEESRQDYFNWNTNTRTTAIVLTVLSEVQPTNALLPNVVRWLMYVRSSDRWETFQETAWAIFGLTNWMMISGDLNPNYTFSAELNNQALFDNKSTTESLTAARQPVIVNVGVPELLKGDVNRLLLSRSAGQGTLYYTAHLTAYLPVDQIKAISRGLTVTRKYSLASDKQNAPITTAKVGDNIRVTLTLVVSQDMPNVVLTDPIPAGTESINPNLDTSVSVGTTPQLNYKDPFNDGYGWWWFGNTQLKDEKTVLSAEYLPAGTYTYTYVVRAGLAGVYNVIPTTIQQVYFPDVYGRSDGLIFTITN